jgi:hypothetical protein
MNATYRTCTYIYDTGGACNSAAVKEQNYCAFHLSHRALLMRAAKARARRERFELKLPPLESMQAVQASLSQLAQALDADMIDVKRADRLIRVLNLAARNLLKSEKWPAASVFHSDQPAEIDVAAQYGLPKDLDINLAPEAAFPSQQNSQSVTLSGDDASFASPESKDPFVSTEDAGSGHQPPATDQSLPELPFSGHYCGDHQSRECECMRVRRDFPLTPEMVEVVEVTDNFGPDVAAIRSRQLMRNKERRRLNSQRKRYEAIALERNMRRGAELMAQRLVAERSRQEERVAKKEGAPPLSPESGDRVGSAEAPKKPATSVPAGSQTIEKAELTPTG